METIDDVIDRLGAVIDESYHYGSFLGLFACLYRRMTIRIKDAMGSGVFDDPDRMERLDVAFAARYFDALDQRRSAEPATMSWEVAFKAVERPRCLVIQHLLLGINAHINLDLGIVTAELVPKDGLGDLEADFMRVNGVLQGLLDDIQDEINRLSPWFSLVDVVGGRNDEQIFGFKMARARDSAWAVASELSELSPQKRPRAIQRIDQEVARFGKWVHRPPGLLGVAQRVVRHAENDNVRTAIELLRD